MKWVILLPWLYYLWRRPSACVFGPSVLLDAGGALGYLAAHEAMKLAYYARLALERDYIGVALCNTRPMVAAYGGIEAVFGTNPLAVAIPAERIPLVLDMSTSRVTYGDLLVAGERLGCGRLDHGGSGRGPRRGTASLRRA